MVKARKTLAARRDSREWALQLLFQLDLNSTERLDRVFADFWNETPADPISRRFAEGLVRGVREHVAELDATMARIADNWDVRRMGVVDRNVIRMGLYELEHHPEIPAAVSINEAVDVAKYFGNAEAGKFVNGILDRARKDMERSGKRQARSAAEPPASEDSAHDESRG